MTWKLVSDRVWSAIFVQCPKCNSGAHILQPVLEFEDLDEDVLRIPPIKHQPILCQCGHILVHDDIMNRIKEGYYIPSCIWVCPNCSHYQAKCMILTDLQIQVEEGEEWQTDDKKYRRVETYEGDNTLQCKNCQNEYKAMVMLPDDNSVLRGLWIPDTKKT